MVSTLTRARRMAQVAIKMLNKNIANTGSKPSPVSVRILFEEMETKWREYEKIYGSVEDD